MRSIIAITGLAGHAFGSWATKPDRMWLRDDLPKALNHRARILIYGYKSQIHGPSAGNSILRDFVSGFWMDLMQMRKHDAVRLYCFACLTGADVNMKVHEPAAHSYCKFECAYIVISFSRAHEGT